MSWMELELNLVGWVFPHPPSLLYSRYQVFLGVQWPGCADHSTPSSTTVKHGDHTSTPALIAWHWMGACCFMSVSDLWYSFVSNKILYSVLLCALQQQQCTAEAALLYWHDVSDAWESCMMTVVIIGHLAYTHFSGSLGHRLLCLAYTPLVVHWVIDLCGLCTMFVFWWWQSVMSPIW